MRLKKSEGPKILTVQNSRGAEFFMANLRQIPSILQRHAIGFAVNENEPSIEHTMLRVAPPQIHA